jgi:hypothetical protein
MRKDNKPSTRGGQLPPFSIVKEQCGAIGGRNKGKGLGGRGEMKQGNRRKGIGIRLGWEGRRKEKKLY